MSDPAWLDAGRPHVWRPYTQMATAEPALPVVRTEGSRIHLADGRVLLDGIASWWTACHGYNHPTIVAALTEQAARMPHIMFGGLAHEGAYRLAARLAARLPALPHVFFSDSGSVGVEVALKIALQYWHNRGRRGRHRFVCFQGAYHGDTLMAMSVCDPEDGMHANFGAALPAQLVCALPTDPASHAALEDRIAQAEPGLAGIIVEPLVQGAGGMRFHAPQTLIWLRDLADRFGLPLIFDEVFTGFGRTGHFFASEAAAVMPDLMILSKALTAGTLGLAATLAAPWIYESFLDTDPDRALMHGPTFMANPLACASANASLDLFEQMNWSGAVNAIETGLLAGLSPLRNHPAVADVRVRGAIGVVELVGKPDLGSLKRALIAAEVWVRPFRNLVYLTPALTVPLDELDTLCVAIRTVVGRLEPGSR